jgi:hypothetical protein
MRCFSRISELKLLQTDAQTIIRVLLLTISATVEESLDIAWRSQEQVMDETGEVDPKTIC